MSASQTDNKPVHPKPHSGLRHLALFVTQFEQCVQFYTQLMGFAIEWQPDSDNVFLCSGNDNLALHRRDRQPALSVDSRLDHLGLIVDEIDQVDVWHQFLKAAQITITAAPKTHRDGARSFYCLDPDGNSVQLIYHPPISRSATKA